MELDTTAYGYVYRTTNLTNGKTYIGKHRIKQGEPWEQYLGSGRIIANAIRQHGKQNFRKELLTYANTLEELDKLEVKYIQQEKQNGKAEYNILFGDVPTTEWSKYGNLTPELAERYFTEKLSTRDIALIAGCSQPTVIKYFTFLRETDERFATISVGKGLTYKPQSKEVRDRALKTRKEAERLQCVHCNQKIHPAVFKSHTASCVTFPRCEDCGVLLKKRSAKKCKEHSTVSKKANVSSEQAARGALTATHNRWHVKRGIVSETCMFCQNISEENV